MSARTVPAGCGSVDQGGDAVVADAVGMVSAHAGDVDLRGVTQLDITVRLSGLQTTGFRGCFRDQPQQTDYHLTSGTIHGGMVTFR